VDASQSVSLGYRSLQLESRLISVGHVTVCAAANGHVAVVERLVKQAGADPLVRSVGGETAADIAKGVSNTQIHEVRRRLQA
jgi:hypothetical protein